MPYNAAGKWVTHEESAEEKGVNRDEARPAQPPVFEVEDRNWLGLYKDNYQALAQVMAQAFARIEALRQRYGLEISPRLGDEIALRNAQEWDRYLADHPGAKRYNEKCGHLPQDRMQAKVAEIAKDRPVRNQDGSLNEEESEKVCYEAGEAVAKQIGDTVRETEDELYDQNYRMREEKAIKNRGYGYGRDSLSNSMNLPTAR